MSSAEFTEYIAFQRIEPSGWHMDNWRFGMVAAGIVNAVLRTIPIPKGKPRPKLLKPSDFYPPMQKQADPLTPRQIEQLRRKRGKRRHSNR